MAHDLHDPAWARGCIAGPHVSRARCKLSRLIRRKRSLRSAGPLPVPGRAGAKGIQRQRAEEENMKAVVYNGPRDVKVKDVPDPRIEQPQDVLVRTTATNICGSDLHMYEGRTDMEPGRVLGHENLGQVIEVGPAVVRIKVGDWVCLPFNIGCGFCKNCERGLTGYCLTVNPGSAGAAYGFADMGPFNGGQAEYLRVPFGDFNCLRLPPDAEEKQLDY